MYTLTTEDSVKGNERNKTTQQILNSTNREHTKSNKQNLTTLIPSKCRIPVQSVDLFSVSTSQLFSKPIQKHDMIQPLPLVQKLWLQEIITQLVLPRDNLDFPASV